MKKEKVAEGNGPINHSGEYVYGPGQIIMMRFSDPLSKDTIKIPALVTEVHYGSYMPECTILYWNRWNCGTISGSMSIRVMLHRYGSFKVSQEVIDMFEKMYEDDDLVGDLG